MTLRDYQQRFTAHLRDPRHAPRPKGVPARRMRVYADLLYNNVEGFLLACFPICRKILGKRGWTGLVRAFFRDHACTSPYFREIPAEFLRYLAAGGEATKNLPPFFAELAHYEWVELDLETSDADTVLPAYDAAGDLLSGRPLLRPVSRLLAYRWPVHRIGPRFRPGEPPAQATFILAYRDAQEAVRFLEVSAATARLLDLLLADEDLTGTAAVAALAAELPGHDVEVLRALAATSLADLRRQGALLGTRR